MLLVLGLALVLLAISLTAVALRGGDAHGVGRSLAMIEAMRTAPTPLTQDADQPFQQRVGSPARTAAVRLGRRLIGAEGPMKIRRKLERAGNPAGWDVERFLASKVFAGAGALVLLLVLAPVLDRGPVTTLVIIAGASALGFFLPDILVLNAAQKREEEIRKTLADAVDLLTISVESGLGFDAALQQVAQNTDGPLADELARVLREMQIGMGRGAAMRALGERSELADLKSFVSALVQADAFGIPIGQVLRVQTAEMRVKRRQHAEEKAQQLPVKITVPLIFCILPCLFIAVLGPAGIAIMESGL